MSNEQTQTIYVQKAEGNGLAVAGLVLGIIAVVLNWVPFLPYILGVLAIIFGAVGMRKTIKRGMSITAIILGVVSIGMKILFWVGIASLGSLG
ncbi:hypothetical protein [Neobacillus vireti]|uniref:DUF4190 domain-containing protein n=1 Tax=Neobacillus vireti LMG 21834 TaxID=1131730 RepID=A0AB94IT21_9BACI|nr:hypothetical protein [Neobacillus vireti]ETI70219.1 hypothetical protein BAVI_03999 [Neobacillus vireti LMG 21834]KLT16418.1 hypothetical protein AA980_18245 [Neobacillus vireti]